MVEVIRFGYAEVFVLTWGVSAIIYFLWSNGLLGRIIMPIEICSMAQQLDYVQIVPASKEDSESCCNSGLLSRVLNELLSIATDKYANHVQEKCGQTQQSVEVSITVNKSEQSSDGVYGSSPTSPLMIEEQLCEEKAQGPTGVAAPAPSFQPALRRCESVDMGQLLHIVEIAEANKADRSLQTNIGRRSWRSSDGDKFMNTFVVAKRTNSCSRFNVSGGSIWQMKKVIEYTQLHYPLSLFQQWQYGQENSGFVHLTYLLEQADASLDMLCQACECLACLCENSTEATTFAQRMNGVEFLFRKLIQCFHSDMHTRESSYMHDEEFGGMLLEPLLCVLVRADATKIADQFQRELLLRLRELFFVHQGEQLEGFLDLEKEDKKLEVGVSGEAVRKVAQALQSRLKERVGDLYSGTLPLADESL